MGAVPRRPGSLIQAGHQARIQPFRPSPCSGFSTRWSCRCYAFFVGALRAGYGKRIFFVVMFWACAVIPLFAVYAFVPKLFQALKLTGNLAAYGSMGITLILVIGCCVVTWLINYLGRRTIIIHSFL